MFEFRLHQSTLISEAMMRQFFALFILVGLFVVLVGSHFVASDGDKLANISRITLAKLQKGLSPSLNLAEPVDALRRELPTRPEDEVRSRLAVDKRLAGVEITVIGEGSTIRLRGVMPDAKAKRVALSLAENTAGVEQVADELGVPE